MLTTALSAFLGALLTLLVSMYIEYQRKPKLDLFPEHPPIDLGPYQGAEATRVRHLRVYLRNREMPKLLRWLGRDAAMHCSGNVQFYHLDNGDPIFSEPMPLRWSASEEPISTQLVQDSRFVRLFDPGKYSASAWRNCYPGNKEPIDIVARFDDDAECYGWSNEVYLPGNGWRNKNRKLNPGRYLAKITVYSAGERVSDVFKFDCTVSRQHFQLSPAKPEEKMRIG